MRTIYRLLVVDDEKAIGASLKYLFEDQFEVFTTTDPNEGVSLMREKNIDIVLLDLRLGNQSGIDFLEPMLQINPQVRIIMMTAYGTIETSLLAMKRGAYAYIEKPLNMEELKILVDKSVEFMSLSKRIQDLQDELQEKYSYQGIIGKSKIIEDLYCLIKKVKDIDSTVLISGESGTGKELVAKTIHYSGNRQKEPFIDVNCAAIPAELLESELFGHVKGAFTGATQDKMGKLAAADKGTIFLDEIGEMPLSLQSKLLRVLQEKEVIPLGSTEKVKIHARILSATNRDLRKEVAEGRFREDLYYRLNVIPIHIPPLRERREDIPYLIHYFIEKYAKEMDKEMKGAEPTAMKVLMNYPYPGNVRELSNIIERAVALSVGLKLKVSDLPQEIIEKTNNLKDQNDKSSDDEVISISFGETLKEIEKKVILFTLEKLNGHRKKTADVLGISERGLREKLSKYKN